MNTKKTWTELGSKTDVYISEYEAEGFGRTNCMAFRVGSEYAILNPSPEVTQADLDYIQAKGPITTLIEPHAGHTMGLKVWKKMLPEANVFTAPRSVARVQKIAQVNVRPISRFHVKDPSVHISVAPGSNNGSLLIEICRGSQDVVYADEIIEDLTHLPGKGLFARWIAYFMGIRTGRRVNWMGLRFFVKDRKALAQRVQNLLAREPLTVFAHGPVISSKADHQDIRRLLATV